MKKNDVFFIGLGMGGSTIVNELRKRAYSGIMIDCNTSNMNVLKMQQESDYYLLGGTRGTGGQREVGREYIEKDLWKIHDRLMEVQKFNHVVIVACADSGVSGGSEVLIRYIKREYPQCKIGIISIIRMQDTIIEPLVTTIAMCKENDRLKQEGLLESSIYVENSMSRQKTLFIDALDKVFRIDETLFTSSNTVLEEIMKIVDERIFRVHEEVIPILKRNLVEECSRNIRRLAEYGITNIEKFLNDAKDKQEQREQERQKKQKEQGIKSDKSKEVLEDLHELDNFRFTLNLSNAQSELKGILHYLDKYLSVIND